MQKEKAFRITQKREIILDVLKNTNEHLSALNIYFILKRKNVEVGLATIYRTLDLFSQNGIVSKINIGDGTIRYEYVHRKRVHHHHLVCIRCGKLLEYTDEKEQKFLEELSERIKENYGFNVLSHEIYLYGICQECIEKEKS